MDSILMAVLLPPGGPIIGVLIGLLVSASWYRTGFAISVASALVLYLASTPVLSTLLSNAAGGGRAVDMSEARRAEAIVVLAAGLASDTTEESGVTLGPLTLERIRYAAKLSKALGTPIAVTGGSEILGMTEAEAMRIALTNEYGVTPRWVESKSKNTRESASLTAEVLKQEDVRRILLVTHPFDVKRARSHFDALGLEVVPAPAQVAAAGRPSFQDFLPSIWALVVSHYAIYELLALGRDWLQSL
jgi:uncharacterized SAM-binding protein YcdF (DUF218 family)